MKKWFFCRAEATQVELLYELTDAVVTYWHDMTIDKSILSLDGEENNTGRNHLGLLYKY